MSEQNDQAVESKGTEKRDELPRKLYPTREEAVAAIPANPPKNTRPFQISKGGEVLGWILAIGYDPAISRAAQIDGYDASTGKVKEAPVTKESASAFLEAMSDEERAAFLAKYMPAPTTTKGSKGK